MHSSCIFFSSNKVDETPPYSLMILESSKPKTLVVYSQNFQDLVQLTIRATLHATNFGDQVYFAKTWLGHLQSSHHSP
jgi:hypothetical protein